MLLPRPVRPLQQADSKAEAVGLPQEDDRHQVGWKGDWKSADARRTPALSHRREVEKDGSRWKDDRLAKEAATVASRSGDGYLAADRELRPICYPGVVTACYLEAVTAGFRVIEMVCCWEAGWVDSVDCFGED